MIKIHKKPKTQPIVTQNLNTSQESPQDLFKVGDKVIVVHHGPKKVRTIIGTSISRFTGSVLYNLNNESTYYAGDLKKLNPTKQDARTACADQEELCFIDMVGFLQQGIPQELMDNPVRGDMTHVRMNGAWHIFFTGPMSQ